MRTIVFNDATEVELNNGPEGELNDKCGAAYVKRNWKPPEGIQQQHKTNRNQLLYYVLISIITVIWRC
jgi:hypothetical protein